MRRAGLLIVAIGSNLALIGVWVVTRTAGSPWGPNAGHAQSAGFVDIVCVAIEALFVAAALALLFRPFLGGGIRGRRSFVAAIVPVAVLAVTTAAIASPSARNHTHTDDAAGAAHTHDAAGAAAAHAHGATTGDNGLSLLHNGHHARMVVHTLTPIVQARLNTQLAVTQEVAAAVPDGRARRDGGLHAYRPVLAGARRGLRPWHDRDPQLRRPHGRLRPAPPARHDLRRHRQRLASRRIHVLLDEREDTPRLRGPNDFWHIHKNICFGGAGSTGQNVLGGDDTTPADCAAIGGRTLPVTSWMVHVWSVPGWDVPAEHGGMFGEVNPKVTCGDGTYWTVAKAELPKHPLNVCRSGGTAANVCGSGPRG